jgi:hypothetical protein
MKYQYHEQNEVNWEMQQIVVAEQNFVGFEGAE